MGMISTHPGMKINEMPAVITDTPGKETNKKCMAHNQVRGMF
jgi:hypothetical protein